MVHSVLPYTVRGCFWYQGEANWKFPREYQLLLHSMIGDLRKHWGDSALPFIVIQLPNYGGMGNSCWTELRRAQASVASLPNTGVVTTIDLGEPKQIHPTNKQDVGKRLALMVRHLIFGETLIYTGPEFSSASPNGKLYKTIFNTRGSALQLKDSPFSGVGFEVAGTDRVFHAAKAAIQGNQIDVISEEVQAPVALRYCWRDGPAATLFNTEGLPSAPFRTDDWTDAK
jgi:sialate O-acetylesterase